jgi:SAM-dependent methyltransferase
VVTNTETRCEEAESGEHTWVNAGTHGAPNVPRICALCREIEGEDVPEKPVRLERAAIRKLDVGAGAWDDEHGYLKLDIVPHFHPDVLGNARRLPFKDGSLQAIRCWHVLEHIRRESLVEVMNDLWRVLQPSGKLWIEVPLFPTEDAIADPTHVSFFVSGTFDYFTKDDGHDEHRVLYNIRPWAIERRERLNHGKELALILRKVEE